MNRFEELLPKVEKLAEKCDNNGHIDPELYDRYEVKRGLRYKSGRGVLTGLTEIGEVKSYTIDDGYISFDVRRTADRGAAKGFSSAFGGIQNASNKLRSRYYYESTVKGYDEYLGQKCAYNVLL